MHDIVSIGVNRAKGNRGAEFIAYFIRTAPR
jgi:hypothetical protein